MSLTLRHGDGDSELNRLWKKSVPPKLSTPVILRAALWPEESPRCFTHDVREVPEMPSRNAARTKKEQGCVKRSMPVEPTRHAQQDRKTVFATSRPCSPLALRGFFGPKNGPQNDRRGRVGGLKNQPQVFIVDTFSAHRLSFHVYYFCTDQSLIPRQSFPQPGKYPLGGGRQRSFQGETAGALVAASAETCGDIRYIDAAFAADTHAYPVIGNFA